MSELTMMKCCQNCFNDSYLYDYIRYQAIELDTCGYCKSKDVLTVEPNSLCVLFEPLVDAYILDENGKTLVDCFRDDWFLFSSSKMNSQAMQVLLGEILDDANVVRKLYSLPISPSDTTLKVWEEFKEELKHSNRFFIKKQINEQILSQMFPYITLLKNDRPEEWFRARLQYSQSDVYGIHEMGAPPKDKVGHGRANPAGIPYLYIASQVDTAVSEVRPHTGDAVSVATIIMSESVKLLDLRDPKLRASPFEMLGTSSDIGSLKKGIEFLDKLGEELTRPVRREAAAYDYVPSQFLCELIKHYGYDGVVYKSSVGEGFNAALFDPSLAEVTSVKSFVVKRVTVDLDA
ncbi:RES domain-containing protein [Shewanella salipaludis]|uniref:RES domain-containing protein n=1 Tax=Shewanella salipaludis TaxID=2723052 RepID=A0A972JM82_9GAMM|nr:RES domain-containing protein [Shewanella salipaludis]NMH66232.1 RES domain-containing protein [Shewanella salipaludis]